MPIPITEIDLDPISTLCVTLFPPSIVTGVLRQVVIEQFSNPANIRQESLKETLWDVDPKKTEILIDPVYRWNVVNLQSRPAVIIKRNQMQTMRIGLDDKIVSRADPTNRVMDGTTHAVLMKGSHTLFCIGGNGEEAERLGAEVFFCMLENAPLIRKDMDLAHFMADQIAPVARLDEEKEHYVTPVVVAWAYFHTWDLVHQAPLFKGIKIQVSPG